MKNVYQVREVDETKPGEGIGKCEKKSNSGNTVQLGRYFRKGNVGEDFNQVDDAGSRLACRS